MSINSERQKRKERFFVKQFVKQIGWKCEVEDDEKPDFKIQFPDKEVGLEITHLYKGEKERGSELKREEGERNKWLYKASEIYYKKSDIPIFVTINILEGKLDSDPSFLAYELLERNNVEVLKKIDFEFKPTNECKLKVSVRQLPTECSHYDRWICFQDHMSYVLPLSEKIIQQKINSKASKLDEYRKKYDDIILLIALEAIFGSGMFDFDNSEIKNLEKCGFSSVHIFRYPDGPIISY